MKILTFIALGILAIAVLAMCFPALLYFLRTLIGM